jgi:hypothetical protein
MAMGSGWHPLRRPPRSLPPAAAASPFSRLAVTHAFLIAGDTLVTMALAGSLFFSISPSAARGRVALYLLLTMAPFALVAPVFGPSLDRTRGGRKLMVVASGAGRAVACLLMAEDLEGLLLFPEAFAVLVLAKAYTVAKSALVPGAVTSDEELVEANAKLAVLAVVVGLVAAGPGIIVLKTLDGSWVLRLASLVFLGGSLAAFRIVPADPPAEPEGQEERAELRSAGIVLAASGMALLRAIVGFLAFLVAFHFRRSDAPSWWYGIVLAASLGGTFLGTVVAPRLRRSLQEERILLGSLVTVAVVGLVAARGGGRLWTTALAATVGMAAGAGKLAFDALVQRDAPDASRGRSFARFEARFQLAWVVGAFIPVVIPIPSRLGFLVIALAAAFAAFSYAGGRRAAHRAHGHQESDNQPSENRASENRAGAP